MNINESPSKTRFFFIRHGQTEHNKQRILQGHLDIPLNDEGLDQASKVALSIKPMLGSIDEIFSSDLSRCRQTTGAILDQGYQGPVTYDGKFRERFMGEIQGMKVDDAVEFAQRQGKSHYKQFGELPHDFHGRVLELITDLKAVEGRNVVVVSHGGFIRALLKNLGFQQDDFIVYNTSITTVDFDRLKKEFEIVQVGDTKHLGAGEFKVVDYRLR